MARLTQAPKPKLPTTDKRRRHTDPPALWLMVATGSVVFHLLLVIIILPLQARRAGEQPQIAPVAIDLVELDPTAEVPVAIAPNSTQSDTATQQLEFQPSPSIQPIEAFPPPPPELEPTPEPPEPPPEPPVEEPPTPVPPPTESERSTDSSTEETDSGETDSTPGTSTGGGTTAPAPADESASAGGEGNTNPDSSTSDSGLPTVSVDANVQSTGWVISPVVSPRPDRPFDIPTQLATVKSGRDRLPDPTSFGCPIEPGGTAQTAEEQYAQYLAEADAYLGTPVNVNVTVESNGFVSDAQIGNTASDSHAYNQLALCLVTNWLEFNPALREGVPWASDNQQVTITISSVQ
ncbi:MAG: energy transducer TonB [Leptolyngbyaceae cyanobacterium SL_5_9]|nr:energy transducer TonB [Leptolyngbyaceae cyanobacterium SL_5_9]NJO73265.1 energy transducer TonB [Leptolyngbyaceae cyanobacterium RM1_406_9]